MIRTAVVALTAFAALATARAQTPGILITPVLDNATISVNRLRMEAESGESVHTHPFGLLVVLLTDADVERTLAGKASRTHETAGSVWFAPKDVPHASRNTGKAPVEAIAVAVKPDRPSASGAPATAAPPGITRTTILDNDDVRVVRVRFTTEGREPVHTHPNDLLTIQLTSGRVEMSIGSEKTTSGRGSGFIQFVPRNVPHAYASADTKPFELISVAIK